MTETNGDNFEEELEEILKDVEMEEELPQLPLVFTARDGETRQIGIMELLPDGTIRGTVYAGAESALKPLFAMPLAFNVDGNVHFTK